MTQAVMQINGVSKRFGATVVLNDVSLTIGDGEFLSLLGPSGCGKTTLLRILGGFETPDAGSVLMDGVDITRLPPNKRPINMLFQSYAVFPHLTVAQNVAYGLRMEKRPAAEIDKRVSSALALMQMESYAARPPDLLSGGQRQRVALARALVKRPRVLLLDEPLSALDAKLRNEMQAELARLQKELGITFIVVTHDQGEALSMSDRIAVMQGGGFRQIDTPQALYDAPNSRFVAEFVGRMNIRRATLAQKAAAANGGGADITLNINSGGALAIGMPYTCAQNSAAAGVIKSVAVGDDLYYGIRPEKIQFLPGGAGGEEGATKLAATVDARAYYGDETLLYCKAADGERWLCSISNTGNAAAPTVGDAGALSWQPQNIALFSPED